MVLEAEVESLQLRVVQILIGKADEMERSASAPSFAHGAMGNSC